MDRVIIKVGAKFEVFCMRAKGLARSRVPKNEINRATTVLSLSN